MAIFRSILFLLSANVALAHVCKPEEKLAASLKPITPIKGTNLFLNTPYKWHDHTKPGCYVMWLWRSFILFPGKHPGVSMVCNANDQKWYYTTDADWILERTIGEESTTEYEGTVRIKNVGAEKTLKSWKVCHTWWAGLGPYVANPANDMWNVRSDSNDNNNLQLEIHNWYLAQKPVLETHRAYLYLKKGDPAAFPYSFIPVIDLKANLFDFEFVLPLAEELEAHTSQKDLIDAYVIDNDSPATITRTITVSERVINEFSWGLSKSLRRFVTVTGSPNIPYYQLMIETGFEIDVACNKNWSHSVAKLFQMSYDVVVPNNTKVTITSWYDLIKDLRMDYTAKAKIFGKTSRITVFDDIVSDAEATGEMIASNLKLSSFDGEIIRVDDTSVTALINGTLVASVGVRGRLNVNGETVVSH